jgi:peptide/histidine transporter 3/4
MEQVLMQKSTFTIREKYCQLTYKIRTFKSKGATLLIVWNILVMNLPYYLLTQTSLEGVHSIALLFTLPIAGWLADVYLGRYKVIQWSMWIMWVGSMLATLSSVVALLVGSYASINKKVTAAILVLQAIGFAGYQANIYQFGIDQLLDASTNAIKSFISWFVWTYFTGGIAGHYIYECIDKQYYVVGQCFISVCLTIALATSFFLNGILIKEPVVQNPYKLVYKVIKYALKNKHPQRRSAFTYCEDELPSRLDFGKNKYGGPFTTEQVEDVKTFLRVLVFTTFCSFLPGEALIVNRHSYKLIHFISHHGHTISECFVRTITSDLHFLCGIVLIPLHEFIMYPLLYRYFHWVKSSYKFLLGVVLQTVRIVALMLIEIEARRLYVRHYGSNSNVTIQCIFWEEDGALSGTIDNWWMAIPNILNSVSFILFGVGAYEFICAQTPYSMRGLIFGWAHGNCAIFILVGYGISELFTRHLINWDTGTISCGFWYLLLIGLLMVIHIAALSILIKHYKRRKREDVLPNEHIFAERYYDRDTDSDVQP